MNGQEKKIIERNTWRNPLTVWVSIIRFSMLGIEWISGKIAHLQQNGENQDIVTLYDTFPHYIPNFIIIVIILSSIAIWSYKRNDFLIAMALNSLALFGYLLWFLGSPIMKAGNSYEIEGITLYFLKATWWDMIILLLTILLIILQAITLFEVPGKRLKFEL